MLPFLKKKRDAAAAVLPAWHPNFRNFERLPDTKVVRTAFFANGVALFAAVVMLLWFAYQEYQLNEIRDQIADWKAQIERDRRGSEQAVALFKKFQADGARLAEIETFLKSKPAVSTLLLRLGETLPANVAVDTFSLGPKGLKLMGAVRGSPDLASGHASTYLDQLRADTTLKQTFESATLVNLNRDAQTGRIAVEYFLAFKGEGKKSP